MYTQDDFKKVKLTARREILIALGFMLLGVAFLVASAITRSRIVGIIGFILPLLVGYAWFSLRAMPWQKYARFISDIFTGLSRKSEGEYLSLDADTHMTEDGIEVHCVNVRDASGTDVIYYWDIDRPFPAIDAGKHVNVTSYGRYITSLIPA